MRHAVSFILAGAASLSSSAMAAAPVGIEIRTDETMIDDAVALAVRTLTRNVSEKWGTICPVLAPAWRMPK